MPRRTEFPSQHNPMSPLPHELFVALRNANRLCEFKQACEDHGFLTLGHVVDPREWFGPLTQEYTQIPTAVANVLFGVLHERKDTVLLFGRRECELPEDWTLPLVRRLVNAGVKVNVQDTCPSLDHENLCGNRRVGPT